MEHTFSHSCRDIILVFQPSRSYKSPTGTPLAVRVKYGAGKVCNFRPKCRLPRKRYEIGLYCRTLQVADRSMLVPMTLSDLERRDMGVNFPDNVRVTRLVLFDLERVNLAGNNVQRHLSRGQPAQSQGVGPGVPKNFGIPHLRPYG